jgi:hypothetical protein
VDHVSDPAAVASGVVDALPQLLNVEVLPLPHRESTYVGSAAGRDPLGHEAASQGKFPAGAQQIDLGRVHVLT